MAQTQSTTEQLLTARDGCSCTYCEAGVLERRPYNGNDAAVCSSCGVPNVQLWGVDRTHSAETGVRASMGKNRAVASLSVPNETDGATHDVERKVERGMGSCGTAQTSGRGPEGGGRPWASRWFGRPRRI
ncbi:hypothetical protein OB905_10945 [Halobacteria archaeon AArc-dxtr1]|nr:hypothetical protein [Halobacteria archaeon AArc-dxtr1]